MIKRINRSKTLARLIEWLGEFLAKRRGLPVIIGIVLVVASFVIQIIDVYTPSQGLRLAGVITQNLGILTALVGLLLSQPLGK
ncbi:MAG: hypothetical protein K8I82_11000 [Anaerolineae bacterium]|nr:hypothetical protein [Anaerolineae bacterium]